MRLLTLAALGAALLTAVGSPSAADVTAVSGSAFGARANVQLFGGTPIVLDATPTVTLPASGQAQTGSVPSIAFQAGPAQLLSTGAADVNTQGTLGAGGSVTSNATVQNIVLGGTTIATLSSTCTANETGATGSTTVTTGRVPTGDTNRSTEGDETYTDVPANPAPNTTLNGLVPSVATDYYRVVFNEQVVAGNTITVNAAHFFLGEPAAGQNPVATGEVIVGQVVCGVTATATSTSQPTGSSTTVPPGGSTTTVAPGGSTTTTSGVTTTTVSRSTTTTTGGSTTTSTTAAGGGSGGSSSGPSILARTGAAFQSLTVLSLLALVLGALTLIGFANNTATAGATSGPWTAIVRQVQVRRRRRRPWQRRRWFS